MHKLFATHNIRLSKRQWPATFLLRTPMSHMIIFNRGILPLSSNLFLFIVLSMLFACSLCLGLREIHNLPINCNDSYEVARENIEHLTSFIDTKLRSRAEKPWDGRGLLGGMLNPPSILLVPHIFALQSQFYLRGEILL